MNALLNVVSTKKVSVQGRGACLRCAVAVGERGRVGYRRAIATRCWDAGAARGEEANVQASVEETKLPALLSLECLCVACRQKR